MKQMPTLSAADITSERLLLRRALREADREGFVELSTDPEVQAHIGGPRPRSEVERRFDTVLAGGAASGPGNYVIADNTTDRLIGTLMLARRSPEDGGELELGA
ncbi:GNAT family N-acetyltransferase [Nonomuraea sp. NPDC049646]|uniref:GNAT family N-acetyltransferase n=1 Tax=unclassified Nonomuraea TaxID=2593643 RepID=UPI0037B9950B